MTETWLRLWVKTIEWRLSGIILAALLGYAFNGDWRFGAIFGGSYNLIRMVMMIPRDKAWAHTRWGRIDNATQSPRPSATSTDPPESERSPR